MLNRERLIFFLIVLSILAISLLIFFSSSQPDENSGNSNKSIFVSSPNSDQPIENENEFVPSKLQWASSTISNPWQIRDSQAVYVFDNKIWLTGGLDATLATANGNTIYENAQYFNDIWSSADGEHWEKRLEHASYPPLRSSSIVYFRGALYMIGGWSPSVGYNTGIWKSIDGINWSKASNSGGLEEREGQKIIEFQGKLFLIGGVNYAKRKTYNDVWYSDDAINWTKLASSTPWHSRWDHDVVVYKDRIWLTGGMDFGRVGFSDTWSSNDGINWDLVSAEAPWGKRQGHGLVVFNNLLWMVGGLRMEIAKTDSGEAFYSDDGITWTKTELNGPWRDREDHGVIVFKDKIWILGGMDGNLKWHNDVWSSHYSE